MYWCKSTTSTLLSNGLCCPRHPIGYKRPNHVPINLGRQFLATINSLINCRNDCMPLELNIFNIMKKPNLDKEEDEPGDAYLINTLVQDYVDDFMSSKLEEFYEQPAAPGEGELPNPPII